MTEKTWAPVIEQSHATLSRALKGDSYLLFHDDADGCSAAAILLSLASATNNENSFLDFASPETHSVELTDRILGLLTKAEPKTVVSLDLAFSTSVQRISQLLKQLNAHMLAYDHHVQSKNQRWPLNCTHINPLTYSLGNMPACVYSNVLYRHYVKLDDADWVAAVGVVADHRTRECAPLIKKVRKRYPHLYPFKEATHTLATRSPLMTMANLVNAGYQHSDWPGARIAVEALKETLQSADPSALLEGRTEKTRLLHRFREEVSHELKHHLSSFDAEVKEYPDYHLAIYYMEPKLNITSQIANQLQDRKPGMIIAVVSPETKDTLKVSLRKERNLGLDLSNLAETTTATLEGGSGGGHPDAAGCVFLRKDFEVWKGRTLSYLKQMFS